MKHELHGDTLRKSNAYYGGRVSLCGEPF